MAYAEVTVVMDGVVDSEETFTDETLLNVYLTEVEDDAKADGYPTEVYVMYHEHSLELGCECIQYEQSLKAKLVFNIEDVKGDWQ